MIHITAATLFLPWRGIKENVVHRRTSIKYDSSTQLPNPVSAASYWHNLSDCGQQKRLLTGRGQILLAWQIFLPGVVNTGGKRDAKLKKNVALQKLYASTFLVKLCMQYIFCKNYVSMTLFTFPVAMSSSHLCHV
jgi:hypothetical protein